jgi:hypothetical protein
MLWLCISWQCEEDMAALEAFLGPEPNKLLTSNQVRPHAWRINHPLAPHCSCAVTDRARDYLILIAAAAVANLQAVHRGR